MSDDIYKEMDRIPVNVNRIDTKPVREKDDVILTDDSSFTFRVNSELKAQFSHLCRRDQYSAASALKRYMLFCVRKGEITHDLRRR